MKRFNIINHGKSLFVFLLACALASPMTTIYAKDNVSAIKAATERKKGELLEAGKTTLNDANLALKAALGIEKLEGDQLWAADLFDEGNVSLDHARIILCAALGIEDVETTLLKNADYVVKNYLSVEAKTDQQAYQPGEQAEITITTKNDGDAPISVIASTTSFGFSGCVDCKLVDETGKEIDWQQTSRQDQILTGLLYFGSLMPQESKETTMTVTLPQNLSPSRQYSLKVTFGYTNGFGVLPGKTYFVELPFRIEFP